MTTIDWSSKDPLPFAEYIGSIMTAVEKELAYPYTLGYVVSRRVWDAVQAGTISEWEIPLYASSAFWVRD